MSINSVAIMGRLVADPELRKTQTGLSVSTFTVAVDRRFGKDAEKKTDFIEIVCWKQQAEFVTKHFTKGSMIAVEGMIQTRNYEDKQGIKRKAVEIVANNVSFCGDKKPSGDKISVTVDDQSDYKDIPDGYDDLPWD